MMSVSSVLNFFKCINFPALLSDVTVSHVKDGHLSHLPMAQDRAAKSHRH